MDTISPDLSNMLTSGVSPLTRTEVVGEEIIRHRAYERFVSRGMQEGHSLDDWLQAEQEVIAVIYGTNV